MTILVAYASKYGATKEIAERIGETLRASGLGAEVQSVRAVGDLGGYDTFVIGSAAYFGSWLREAAEFVRRHRALLASRPVWLFSSGPISAEATDAEGRDLAEVSVPKEIAEFAHIIHLCGHRVFLGKLDPGKLGFLDRLVACMPAFPGADGDFRDWPAIEAWSKDIAHELVSLAAGVR